MFPTPAHVAIVLVTAEKFLEFVTSEQWMDRTRTYVSRFFIEASVIGTDLSHVSNDRVRSSH